MRAKQSKMDMTKVDKVQQREARKGNSDGFMRMIRATRSHELSELLVTHGIEEELRFGVNIFQV